MATQTLTIPESVNPKSQANECRIFERKDCELPTTCQPASAMAMKETRWTGTITNISIGGIRLQLPRRFEKGAGLAIELPGNEERESTVVFVKVVYVKTVGNGTWILGCRFLSELSEDQLQTLLTSTTHILSSSNDVEEAAEPEVVEEDSVLIVATELKPQVLTNVRLDIETKPGTRVRCLIKRLNVEKCWPITEGKTINLRGKRPNLMPWAMQIRITKYTERLTDCELHGQLLACEAPGDVLTALGL